MGRGAAGIAFSMFHDPLLRWQADGQENSGDCGEWQPRCLQQRCGSCGGGVAAAAAAAVAASFGGMRQHRHGAATPNTNAMPLAALGHGAGTSLASQQGQQLHMGHARSDQISCAQLLGHSPAHEPTALGQLCATPVWFLPCSCQMAHRVWPCPCPRAAIMGHMQCAQPG